MLGRRRPLLRAAAVGGGAYAIGKRRARNQADEEAQQVEEPAQPDAAPAPAGLTDSALEELAKLGTLKDQGVLTQEEFDAQKAKILATS